MLALAEQLKGSVAREAAGTFVLRVFHTGIRFLIGLALARMLGASGYGAYSFALTCLGILTVPALLGFDGLLVREVAGYHARRKWALLKGLARYASFATRFASLILAAFAAAVAWGLSPYLEQPMVIALWTALLALPFLSEIRVRQALMTGLHRVIYGQLPEAMVQPAIFLALIGAVNFWLIPPSGAYHFVGLYCLSVLVALIVAVALVQRLQETSINQATPEYVTCTWIRGALPFGVVSGLHVLSASLGIIMLGPMMGAEATGLFSIANAAAALAALPLRAVNAPLAPAVSAAFSDGSKRRLQQLTTKAARSAFLTCLPLALAYVLFGKWVLSLFGAEFTAAHTALVILTVGQMINASMGSVGVLLQMTGHDRDVVVAVGIALIVNFLANVVLIPFWGICGAAVGSVLNIAIWNILLAHHVRRRLGIRPTVLA